MPLAFQPAIEGAPLSQRAPQQSAIEVGNKNQLGIVGQGSRKLLLQKLAGGKVVRRRHDSSQGWATYGGGETGWQQPPLAWPASTSKTAGMDPGS